MADNKKQKTETPEEKVRKSAAENVTPKEEVKLGEQKEGQKPETSVKKEEESTYLWKNTELERKLEVSPNEISIIEIVDAMVNDAFQLRTSDIHIDPEETELKVRFRIDGVLQDFIPIPKELHSEIITRIKVLSGLRTDEHQAAQDGRFKASIHDYGQIDLRVSIAPTYYGENCVMRLLAAEGEIMTLEILGYSEEHLEIINRAIKKPYGMILATGPTGSGKTTTLYAILKKLNRREVSIITLEDPVEYSIEGINQIQVNPRTGMTFAQGLRFILRQDPDIIMVGEIRDNEAANIAVNAAMTGHLLLSTLHTNDATVTIPRLLDMGVEPFLIASTVNIAMGQRLVRTLCTQCRVPKKLTNTEIENVRGLMNQKFLAILEKNEGFYGPKGCEICGGSGYRGRIGIHEILEIDDDIRELVMKRMNAKEIRNYAIKKGMTTMFEDGIEKAAQGLTTIEEIFRVFHE